jgi:FAD/FMN-containing dehydrogenase/Fe-S oxidoreductase
MPSSPDFAAAFANLAARIRGEVRTDSVARAIYATDASEYQERPLAVALPASEADCGEIVRFAAAHRIPLVPRAAGTSLAGQVVGGGIVVDLGRHLNNIVALDVDRRRVRVQPGVIRNELNRFLAPHGLFFAPETSTAGWAMIGGMVGNNSCGSNSIAWGTTRDHLVSVRGFLADGSEATFGPLAADEFAAKCSSPDSLKTRLYRLARDMLGDVATREVIRDAFPRPEVTRRNTGYALDALMDASPLDPTSEKPFNFCRLLAGSEGTLFLGVEYELNLIPLPPPGALLCVHCESVAEALSATVIVMRPDRAADARPTACELIDRKILDCTRENFEQARNRSFVVGEPGAVLVVEMQDADARSLEAKLRSLETELRAAGLGYAFPLLSGADAQKVWELRRAGQGLINNISGNAKPREIVEDTAVAVADLPAYIAEFDRLLAERYGIDCVHYAHAGAGELHLRPLFDLHSPEGLVMFRGVATDVAALVKKYRGSLSGEHGDGRLRGEFVRFMVGDACYELFRQIKRAFDPQGIFNPGKIVDAAPMDSSLRILPGEPEPAHETVFRFADSGGILRAAEKCTGVGQCRKPAAAGGTMCPSYMATLDEDHTTRARANVLRQALADSTLADSSASTAAGPWLRPELAAVMDLCLSCKACKSECPSNVDMARLKAEWQQHVHDATGVPWRTRLIAGSAAAMRRAAIAPWLYNFVATAPGVSHALKRLMGFAQARSLPRLPGTTFSRWWKDRGGNHRSRRLGRVSGHLGRVFFFADEFTDTLDATIGIKAVELLERLGWEVVIPEHVDSGRAQLSKGLVRDARDLAVRNVELLSGIVSADEPLVGIEPSALLSFRDEYPDLVPEPLAERATTLSKCVLLLDELLARAAADGRIGPDAFDDAPRTILVHGHCHQKALSSMDATVAALSLPRNHSVSVIPSGCCGMAGSFGFEREHFGISMKIGELVLFPAVRAAPANAVIAAPGTSCRHQIADGTRRHALHPVEILHASLR